MKRTAQKGFTLVEIAIVLVIIGLLLGGVLKGQELIDNSRIKGVVADLRGVSTAFNGYRDRYRALPGDETLAVMGPAGRGWPAGMPAPALSDGALAMPLATTFAAAGDQLNMWAALRAAGFITGSPTVFIQPTNSVGGFLGVTSVATYGMPAFNACASGMVGKIAGGVDRLMDDGVNNSGTVRGLAAAANPLIPVGAAPAAPAAYSEAAATTWTLCAQI